MTGEQRRALEKMCLDKDEVTAEDILLFDRVPPTVAARYLGVQPEDVRINLINGTYTFGKAILGKSGRKWMYRIYPENLIAYKEPSKVPVKSSLPNLLLEVLEKAIAEDSDFRDRLVACGIPREMLEAV